MSAVALGRHPMGDVADIAARPSSQLIDFFLGDSRMRPWLDKDMQLLVSFNRGSLKLTLPQQ